MSDFIRQQRMEVLWECWQGLKQVEKTGRLSRLGRAAMEAIVTLYTRGLRDNTAEISHQAMARPVEVAQEILTKAGVECVPW